MLGGPLFSIILKWGFTQVGKEKEEAEKMLEERKSRKAGVSFSLSLTLSLSTCHFHHEERKSIKAGGSALLVNDTLTVIVRGA